MVLYRFLLKMEFLFSPPHKKKVDQIIIVINHFRIPCLHTMNIHIKIQQKKINKILILLYYKCVNSERHQ